MDDLQYENVIYSYNCYTYSFKPCYKWMTFNTKRREYESKVTCNMF